MIGDAVYVAEGQAIVARVCKRGNLEESQGWEETVIMSTALTFTSLNTMSYPSLSWPHVNQAMHIVMDKRSQHR
jgi:hypothetical protein